MARKKDENQAAFSSLQELLRRDQERNGLSVPAIPPEEKDARAVAAGRMGGAKGGKARAKNLSGKRRRAIAKRAAQARWSKRTQP